MTYQTLILATLLLTACATPVKKPFFWSVEKDGKRSYLLGTIHQGVTVQALPDSVKAKLDQAKMLVVETDEKPDDSVRKDQLVRFLVLMSYEPSLDQRLSPKAWQFVQAHLAKRLGAHLKQLSPYGAAIIISSETPVEMDRFTAWSYKPQNGMDKNLIRRAKKNGATVFELDNAALIEVSRFCIFNIAAKSLELMASGHRSAMSEASMEIPTDLYRSGDSDLFTHWINQNMSADDQACLIGLRNTGWISELDPILSKNEGSFVAVGAGHMLTEQESLLTLLRRRGYKVDRL